MGFDRACTPTALADLVRSSGAHLGAVIDPDGEQLTLVDDTGRVLTDGEALLALIRLVGSTAEPGARIVVPVSASREVEALCADLGARRRRAKLRRPAARRRPAPGGPTSPAMPAAGYAFPEFLPALRRGRHARPPARSSLPDGCCRAVVASLAEAPPSPTSEVPTPLEQKGGVMRALVERAEGDEVILIDGVKCADAEGWTLVVPDPELPLTHVYAEARPGPRPPSGSSATAADVEWILTEGAS